MRQEREKIRWKDIRITDSLFGSYVKRVSEKIILHHCSRAGTGMRATCIVYVFLTNKIIGGMTADAVKE